MIGFDTRVILAHTILLSCVLRLHASDAPFHDTVRVATYNASLNRSAAGQLLSNLSTLNNLQARRVAEIIQRVRPDVLLLNEFDYDAQGQAAALFQQNYLGIGQDTTNSGVLAAAIEFPARYVAPSNTGISSGVDFDGDTDIDDYGFGSFPGQFGMAVYSMYPLDVSQIRTFQTFLWNDMPGHRIPLNYTPQGISAARLSSKSHWDIPIQVHGHTLHFLTSHPTPPVFDSAAFDENGRRNADEIRFWADYIDPATSSYIYDDAGAIGGLDSHAHFVIAGDQNSDPFDGDSLPGAANQLVDSARVNTTITPASAGSVEDAMLEGGPNNSHLGDPRFDTADFGAPGNLRVDYVLPSANLPIVSSGVFWPLRSDPFQPLILASDHRLAYVDVLIVPEPGTTVLVGFTCFWVPLAWPVLRRLRNGATKEHLDKYRVILTEPELQALITKSPETQTCTVI